MKKLFQFNSYNQFWTIKRHFKFTLILNLQHKKKKVVFSVFLYTHTLNTNIVAKRTAPFPRLPICTTLEKTKHTLMKDFIMKYLVFLNILNT